MEAGVMSEALGPGFLLLLIVGAFGVFLQRGASFFLPRRALDWPAMGTLNRLLPGALILLAAAALHLAFRRVLLTIVCAVALHFLVFAYVLG